MGKLCFNRHMPNSQPKTCGRVVHVGQIFYFENVEPVPRHCALAPSTQNPFEQKLLSIPKKASFKGYRLQNQIIHWGDILVDKIITLQIVGHQLSCFEVRE